MLCGQGMHCLFPLGCLCVRCLQGLCGQLCYFKAYLGSNNCSERMLCGTPSHPCLLVPQPLHLGTWPHTLSCINCTSSVPGWLLQCGFPKLLYEDIQTQTEAAFALGLALLPAVHLSAEFSFVWLFVLREGIRVAQFFRSGLFLLLTRTCNLCPGSAATCMMHRTPYSIATMACTQASFCLCLHPLSHAACFCQIASAPAIVPLSADCFQARCPSCMVAACSPRCCLFAGHFPVRLFAMPVVLVVLLASYQGPWCGSVCCVCWSG